jgi:hypothetical protein
VRDKHDPDAERLQGADLAKQPIGFPGVNEAVGSSRIRIRALRIRPRRISTIC